MIENLRRRLEKLGHLSVLENVAAGHEIQQEVLGPKSAACFRALHQKDLEEILSELSHADSKSPTAELLTLKGRVHWLLGRTLDARKYLKKSLQLDADRVDTLAYLGVCDAATDPKRSLYYFDKASKGEDRWAWPYLWRAAARIRLSTKLQFHRALADLGRFKKIQGERNEVALLLEGFAYLNLQAYSRAVELAGALIEENAGSGAGFGLRAVARLALGDLEGGFADHHSSRDREPSGGFDVVDILALGQRHWKSGKEYLEMLDAAVKKYPERACFRIRRAEVLRGAEFSRYDLALEDYRRAELLEPNRAWIVAHRARAEGELLGLDKSLQSLDRAVALFPEGGWIYAWRGQVKRLLLRPAAAIEDFNLASEKMPWYSCTYVWKGALLASLRRWPQALDSLTRGLSMGPAYPANALGYYARSRSHRASGKIALAVEDMTTAFLIDGKYEWAGTAAEPATEKECQEAVRDLSGLLRKDPANSWAFIWRGRAYLKMGELSSASKDFTKALILNPRNIWAYQWRGTARKEGAAKDFKSALRIDSQFWPAAVELAGLSLTEGRLREALKILRRHDSHPARNTSFFTLRGGISLRLGKIEEALEDLKRAVLLNQSNVQAYDLLARAFLEKRDFHGALSAADAALRRAPDLVTALMSRGLARGKLGDGQGQIQDFRRAYRLDEALFEEADEAVLSLLSEES